MPVEVYRARDYRRMPWKNGGGETTEMLVFPPGAALDAFDWRISMAHVAADGPFSCFAGIDRTLCVLDGAGLTLDIETIGTVSLSVESAPFAFPADVAVMGRLVEGPITDLNVMTRRKAFRHAIFRHLLSAPLEWTSRADASIVVAGQGGAHVAGPAQALLGAYDAVLIESSGGQPVVIAPADGPTPIYAIELWRL